MRALLVVAPVAALLAAAWVGCGSSPPPADAPPAPSAQAEETADASSEPSASAEPGAGTPPTASASPSGSPSAAPAASAGEAAPPPLTPEEQKQMEKRCKPLLDALNKEARKGPRGTELAILARLLEKPPKMPAADVARCGELLERSIRDYVTASIEVEAKTMLHRMAISMARAFERDKKLCPPTARAVPAQFADVARGPYRSTAADWEAPTWKCLGLELEGQQQRFQYEVKTDPAGPSFEIVARGSPLADGKVVELVQRGSLKPGKGIEIPPPARR